MSTVATTAIICDREPLVGCVGDLSGMRQYRQRGSIANVIPHPERPRFLLLPM
ncbi:MAG: hypothetical protein P8L85_00815 [Rubripirellula sp.]|nr:hypothetical protein [Rubripirellula sp.]